MIISLLVPSNRRGSSRSRVINLDMHAIFHNLQGCSQCSGEISTFGAIKTKPFCTFLYQLESSKYFNSIIAVYFFQVLFRVTKNDTA